MIAISSTVPDTSTHLQSQKCPNPICSGTPRKLHYLHAKSGGILKGMNKVCKAWVPKEGALFSEVHNKTWARIFLKEFLTVSVSSSYVQGCGGTLFTLTTPSGRACTHWYFNQYHAKFVEGQRHRCEV
ncbi:AMP deaminase 3 [Platysternon megacephalum]|uniref:AMP deaminase 3 n=1 Tax=Platysternon megacephalum TaxID=55544 RepID=A0A4D9DX64_9SAUR|nr:AMP deaminase 3 [Platysternon megacephalum]